MADKSDDIFIDDDEFDFDLDLTETEMAWDKKTEADTPIPSTMEVSEKREGKTTATDMEDLEDIDDLDSPPSPSILSSSFSMIHGGESENGSAARENKINALRDSLYAFRANLNSEIHKISDEEKTADQQKHDKTDEMPSDSKIDDEKLNDKEQMRKLSKKTSEEKGVIESSYDTIDLTELEDIETHSAEDPQQGSESAVSPKSDDFSLDIPTCITCRKAKEKRNCTHRHHPYPPISQSQGPSSPSGQGGAQGVGKASFVEQRSNFGSRCGMAQDRDSASEIGLDAVKKESQKLKYSVNVQQVREIFPAVHRHFVRKLLKYLGYKFGDKETILQHAVTFLSETEYPIDGDSQWEIDAAIESLKKVVITPVGINIPKKKEPKSNVERDNFVSNWISKTDFKKAMEAVSSTPSSTDAGNFNLGGPDFDLFGFSNPDSCNLRLGLPLTPTGTSIRSLGTSIASIANSPGPSSLSGHDSSSSSVASFDNFDGKTTEVVGNSSDASVDSVKQLRKTSTSCISPEENLKHLVGKKFSDAEKVGDKKQPLNWSSAKLGPDGIGNSGNRMEGLSDMEVDMGSQSTEMAKLNAKIAKMKRNKDLPTEMAKLKANPEKIKRDKEQIMKAKAQYRRLKDRDSNKSRTEGVGGKTSSSSLFTTDSILRSDVRPKVSVAETVGSTYPRFHPYPQTDKHTSMEKRSSIPEFNFSAPLSSDRPDSVNHSTTISHPVVSSSKEDDDMIMEEYNSVVSSSTIPCDSCKTTYAVKDLGQCCDCHLLCKTCLEKAAKLILVGNKSGQVICPVTDCESSVPRSELRKTLHNIMLDLLDEKWNKEAVDAMNDMEDFVRCSNCGYSVILDLTVKRHCCDKCKKTFCRFCNLSWEAKDHDLCIKTKTKNKTDGSGVIAVPAHWSPTNSEEPYEKAVVEETALEFTSISELFYSTMTRQSFKIERVYRIQNQRLWEKYMLMRTHMVEDLGEMHINERRLFHGTSTEVIPNICKEGFDWRLYGRNGSAFGQGTYFARDANYSHNYSSKHGPFGIGRHGVSASLMRNVLGFGFPTHHKHPVNPPGFFSFGQPNQPAQTGFNFGPYAPPNSGSIGSQPPSFQPNVSGISSTGQQSTGFQLGNSNNASGGGFGGQTQNTGGFMFGNRGGNISNSNTGFSFGGQTHGGPGSYFGSPGSGLDEMEESSGSFMFVGRVLVGRVCKGNPQMRRPPKDENDPQKRPCHTAVNHINKPSIFVVFESSQCYPEYLIEYNSL